MAKTVHSTTPTIMTGDFLTPTSPNLLADKRSHSSGQSSPARVSSTGKTTPSTERRPQMNGHPSPLHLPTSNTTNNNAGTAYVEGYMKTDDRMRLAKERREERERSLAAREQLIKEKERRARLQYERTVEERWRRLEEQRQKEELRRAAVEEKRRQQLEEEKERLDALMKRSLERSLQLEQRNKRWSRGYAAGDSENITPPPLSAASAFPHGIASSLPASSESAPCSPHRSPYRGTLSPADASRAGLQGGSQSTPNTPKKERLLRRARRTASPAYVSPVRRAESPASVSKQLTCPTASRLTSKMRAQSPCAARQHHSSPVRRQSHPSADGDGKEKTKRASGPPQEEAQTDPERVTKKADVVSQEPSSQAEKNGANLGTSKVTPAEPSDKGKAGAGSTNAEEASRLLAERRRQAREQKEIDEIRQTREKEERLKTQQLEKQPSQERLRQEGEGNRKEKEGEEKRQKEEQKGLNSQMEREKQKSKEQEEEEEEEEAERQRLDREQQKRQEEEERQLRKKRIEEIMKRTRKGEADLKEGQLEALAVSTPGELKMNVQTSDIANEQAIQKVTFQVKEQVEKSEDSLKREVSEEATTRVDHKKSMQVKTDTHQDGATKGMNTNPVSARQDAQVSKNGVGHLVKQQEGQVEAGVKKDGAQESGLATVRVNKEPPKKKADAKEKKQEEGVIMNGQVKNPGSVPVKSQSNAEVRKQNGLKVEVRAVTSAPETKANIKLEKEAGNPGTRLSVDPPATPIIRLEPLDVGRPGSGDEVQPMEVSPASKEELISIPEFSPIKETQLNSLSNSCALDELLDLTGTMGYSKLSPVANRGDCNLNLIQGVVNPVADPEAIHTSTASSNTLSIQ